ncbi:MAG TPA: N-acetylmuramoyl-L-alanine amidase [Gaiellaceae bacterium]
MLVLVAALFSVPSAAARPPTGGADYPGAKWVAASPKNFQRADRPFSSPITRIVIHTTEGPYASAIRSFSHPGQQASAAYVIRSSDGAITQTVPEQDIAWHSGNRQYNATSIGIEHEAFVGNCSWYTNAMYRSSARLVAFLTRKYGIPIDRTHIIGHYQVPDPFHLGGFGGFAHHVDPGPCWNWGKYMRLIRADAGETPAQRTPLQVVDATTHAGLKAPGWRLRRPDSTQLFGPSYYLARPSRTAAPASFRLAIPAAGDYAVYGWWLAERKRNPAVPVGIATVTGWHWLTVNERMAGGRWVYLGTFTLPAGKGWDVRIARNSQATGRIAADAVMAEPVGHPLESGLLQDGFGYAVTGSGLEVTSDAGSTWRPATPPGLAATDIRAVRFVDPANGLVVALSGTERHSFGLWRTSDGGLTWTSSRLPMPAGADAGAPISLAAPDASHVLIGLSLQQGLGLPGPGVLLVSSNGGRTWSRRTLPGSGEIAFTSASQGWLAPVDGRLYRTRNGGRTWRRAPIQAPAGFHSLLPLAELPVFSDSMHAALPVSFLRGKRAAVSFLTSSNGGKTWRTAATVAGRRAPSRVARVPAAIAGATDWFVLTDGGSRVVSLENGNRVRNVAAAGLPLTAPGFELADVSFASATTGWATVSTCAAGAGAHCARDETLYRTLDGGGDWARLDLPG